MFAMYNHFKQVNDSGYSYYCIEIECVVWYNCIIQQMDIQCNCLNGYIGHIK